MKRRIIEIDENKCNGCGACAAIRRSPTSSPLP